MAEYMTENVGDGVGSLGYESMTEEINEPLLTTSRKGAFSNPGCLFGQKGFRSPSVDAQSTKAKRQLIVATLLCFAFMIAELIGGYLAGSLAVITDAAHLLSDCISFIVALLAIWFSKKPADDRMSFGYKRTEVFGAILSVLGIWILTAVLLYLALVRLINRNFDIDANSMIIISSIGVAINIVMGLVLHGSCISVPHGHSHQHQEHAHSNNCNKFNNSLNNIKSPSAHSHGVSRLMSDIPAINSNGIADAFDERNFVLSRHNSFSASFSTTHSRHNSFSKILNSSNDLLKPIETASLHRLSIDSGLMRKDIDSKSYSRLHTEDVADNISGQYTSCDVHRNSIDADSQNSSTDSRRQSVEIKPNINIRAAVIHVIGDFIQSIGVLIAALIIKIYPNAKIADPICTFLFSIIVLFTTVRIMKESILVIMDAVPTSIVLSKLETELFCIQGVRSVHHLNVWSLSMDWHIMSVHLIVDPLADIDEILKAATTIAKKGFDIQHVTVQIEKQTDAFDNNIRITDKAAAITNLDPSESVLV